MRGRAVEARVNIYSSVLVRCPSPVTTIKLLVPGFFQPLYWAKHQKQQTLLPTYQKPMTPENFKMVTYSKFNNRLCNGLPT